MIPAKSYSVFFDESQQTHRMRIDDNGIPNFVKDNDLQSAIYVFSVFETSHVQDYRQRYLDLESEYRLSTGLQDDTEIKSNFGKHRLKQFSLGFKTLNKQNKSF